MELQDKTMKSLRRARIGLAILSFTTVLFLIYGATQSIEAQRQADLARQKEKKALQAEEEAIVARDRAEFCKHELAKCRASVK